MKLFGHRKESTATSAMLSRAPRLAGTRADGRARGLQPREEPCSRGFPNKAGLQGRILIYLVYDICFPKSCDQRYEYYCGGASKMAVQGGKTAGPPSVLRGAEWTPRAARGPPTQSRQRASSRNRAVLFLLLRKYNIYYRVYFLIEFFFESLFSN